MEFPHSTELGARRRRMFYVTAVLLFVIGGVVYLCVPDGSFYRGRSLDAWLDDYSNPLAGVRSLNDMRSARIPARMAAAQEAITAIGTNAIPKLLKYLEARDSAPKTVLLSVVRSAHVFRKVFWTENEKHTAAQTGFMVLNYRAASAAPALIGLTKNEDAGVRMRACETLYFVNADPKSFLPVLLPFGHDPDQGNREKASWHMRSILPLLSPEEIEKNKVYETFPELRPTAPLAK